LVLGLGLTGNIVAQIFQDAGTQVFGVTEDAEAAATARACGLQNVLVAAPGTEREKLREVVGSEGFRVTIAARPDWACLDTCTSVCRPHGVVMSLQPAGSCSGADGLEFLRRIHFRWLHLRGVSEWQEDVYSGAPASKLNESLEEAFTLIRSRRVQVDPLLEERVRAVEQADVSQTTRTTVFDWRSSASAGKVSRP
jgi:threonine dehydrogenase-like Zn-dependent dehydrogenase